jgi:hypothetical protein
MTFVVGVSGKIGSGKDYLTGKLIEELNSRGRSTAHTSFAKPLKEELGEIINLLKENRTLGRYDASALVAERYNMTEEQAGWLVTRLYPELDIEDLDGWSRTLGVRGCLQLLGSEIRRAQNPSYWTDKFFAEVETIDADYVFVSDGRFPNEMDAIKSKNGVTFRLNISEETLLSRRMNRDGITYTDEQLNHMSETSLDDYEDFDYLVGEVVDAPALTDFIETKTRDLSVR